jgi:glycosyltransferase involved in cell wall biosynthesis
MITVYTIAYNEEIMLPFMIKWYRDRFPNCRIVIYDNYSTDNTEKIALSAECQVIKYDSENKIRDDLYLKIKNNCWKNTTTDWVIVCDVDELMDISEETLKTTEYDIIGGRGYEMCGEIGDNLEDINKGVYTAGYSKYLCFNTKKVKEINYKAGCHQASPNGVDLKIGKEICPVYHFKWLNEEYVFERYKLFSERLSEQNKKNGWAIHYNYSKKIQSDYYQQLLLNRIKLF